MVEEGDKQLFRKLVGEVRPVKQQNKVEQPEVDFAAPAFVSRRAAASGQGKGRDNLLMPVEHIPRVLPLDILSFKRDGVQHGVFRQLKRGQYPAEASLDLHRMSVEQARSQIFDFVEDCIGAGVRCGLIAHGKGQGREQPALLKSCVNHWLRQWQEVLAFHSAPRHLGGVGATVMLLRKSPEQKQRNREKYQGHK